MRTPHSAHKTQTKTTKGQTTDTREEGNPETHGETQTTAQLLETKVKQELISVCSFDNGS